MNNDFTKSQLGYIWQNINEAARCHVLIHGWEDFIGYCQDALMVGQSAQKRFTKLLDDAREVTS